MSEFSDLLSKKMNKSDVIISRGGFDLPFVIDKSDFRKDLMSTGSWNASCLSKSLDKFVFSL